MHEAEIRRIRAEYDRRGRDLDPAAYQACKPENLFMRQAIERGFVRALSEGGLLPLAGRRVLDVGCGTGQWLADLETWGARRELVAGIDLMPDRAEASRRRVPGADVREGSASELPWEADSFDLVFQVMLLSSVLDESLRRDVCAEMDRVLAPGGTIVSVDFFVDNPANASVGAVKKRDFATLFPGYEVGWRRIMLAPPLVRRLAPRAWWLASLLQSARVFDTHAVAVLSRR